MSDSRAIVPKSEIFMQMDVMDQQQIVAAATGEVIDELVYKVKGKTRTVHVPKDMLEEVKEWVEEHKRMKKLIREISKNSLEIIHRHVPARRAAARGKKKSGS